MNLVTLILYVCLASGDGHDCKEVEFILDGVSTATCLKAGEETAVEWLDTHPDHRLAGLTCQWGTGDKKA